ncbi:hypothetical protein ACM26V_01390 [Salipaludibacillus sp. HK11]|uniref:hypothetical protein n=1 Tax=Salipaludibacillus sp. HK11 TaxID=3394320 RepID=UPI0039FD7600
MSEKLDSKVEENEHGDDESMHHDSVDVQGLPSRKETHKRISRKSRVNKPKKKRIRFPLVRVWLILFLLLVVLVITYPIWG